MLLSCSSQRAHVAAMRAYDAAVACIDSWPPTVRYRLPSERFAALVPLAETLENHAAATAIHFRL